MCGIVGFYGDGISSSLLDRLLSSMENRGPDGEGRFEDGSLHMGMRRLSIIDLAHGWQPLLSAAGDVIAFQNGEIYNFKELRHALEKDGFIFQTNSDTEVIAHGYARWGIDTLLQKIDGMFAIAVFDKRSQTLHLARDRFGEKPLFYTYGAGTFGYGSTLLSVASMPWVELDFDPLSLSRYLAVHYVPGNKTMFKDISQLLPGERLEFNMQEQSVVRKLYYTPDLSQQSSVSDDELSSIIEDAVKSRLMADVPVGVFLSGGIDSSIIAACAAKISGNISTFSMGFRDGDFDESETAAEVARLIGSRHHSFMFDAGNFPVLLKSVAASMDTPIGDQAMLPIYWLSKEARKHVKVVLSGEGGDEVFAGYSYYEKFRQVNNRNRFPESLLAYVSRLFSEERFLIESSFSTPSGFPLILGERERIALLGSESLDLDAWEQQFFDWLNKAQGKLLRATSADIRSWLTDDLLVKLDRMTMAHSLEGRAPFLSRTVVEAGLSLRPKERFGIESKVALRRVARRFLPEGIVRRPKQGFCLPMKQWLVDWFAMYGGVASYFNARAIPLINNEILCRMVEWEVEHGIPRDRFVFAVVLLAEWWLEFKSQRDLISGSGEALC